MKNDEYVEKMRIAQGLQKDRVRQKIEKNRGRFIDENVEFVRSMITDFFDESGVSGSVDLDDEQIRIFLRDYYNNKAYDVFSQMDLNGEPI